MSTPEREQTWNFRTGLSITKVTILTCVLALPSVPRPAVARARSPPSSRMTFRKGSGEARSGRKRAVLAGGPPSVVDSCRIRLQIARRQHDPVVRQDLLQNRDARVVVSGIARGDCLRRRTLCARPGQRPPPPAPRRPLPLLPHPRP